MRKSIFIIVSAMILIVSGCRHNEHEEESGHKAAEVTAEEEHEDHESDHKVDTVKRRPFAPVIRTSGRITVDSKDIEIISAKSSGIVRFSDHFLFPGVKTINGQALFILSGDQLAENNTELDFRQIKADLEKVSANYERAKGLIADKIITQEHFLEIKNEYEKTLLAFNNLNLTFSDRGNIIRSPGKGYIKEIFVTEGQMVTSGQPLASIVIEHKHVLRADVSPDFLAFLPSVEKANFTVGYSKKLFRTEEMNGKIISFGRSTGENSWYVPVYFRMDYDPELIEGTFAEVYLIGKESIESVVVPDEALLEEYGKIYVFIEDKDGDFIKRYVKTGFSDGRNTQILEGLDENELVVTGGAYNVKLKLMTNSAPAHSHNH